MDKYNQLFIHKGKIIHATREFKTLNFKEILEEHEVLNAEDISLLTRMLGGWTKFVKTNITSKKLQRKRLVH